MRRRRKNSLLLPLLITVIIALAPAGRLPAQTFNYVCDLTPWDAGPPDLLLLGNTFYWTTAGNPLGIFGHVGSVYKALTDGSGGSLLLNFGASGGGTHPLAGLVLSSNTLFGTTSAGGLTSAYNALGNGTVFAVNTDGSRYQTLYAFTGADDGSSPWGAVVVSGNTLFGTTRQAGPSGNGTIFKLNTDGTEFTNLYSFSGLFHLDPYATVTNSDGAYPEAQFLLSGSTLYGTAAAGGAGGAGTVFAINTDGSGFTNLHSFAPRDPATGTNSEGASPAAALILSGNTLYGTAALGGASSNGTVFKINIDGTGFTVLHNLAPTTGYNPSYGAANSDGIALQTRLFLSGHTLFGTASAGGSFGCGTVFALNTDGTDFKVLKNFTGGYGDGSNPTSGLVRSGNALYGALNKGGRGGNEAGMLYNISFSAPLLSIIHSGANVILTWPTDYAGFTYSGYTLQSTTNLTSPIWTAVSPDPAIVNSQNTVTNLISSTSMFYRLSQ